MLLPCIKTTKKFLFRSKLCSDVELWAIFFNNAIYQTNWNIQHCKFKCINLFRSCNWCSTTFNWRCGNTTLFLQNFIQLHQISMCQCETSDTVICTRHTLNTCRLNNGPLLISLITLENKTKVQLNSKIKVHILILMITLFGQTIFNT